MVTHTGHSQTQVSPKYSVDGKVNALIGKGDTLIIGGTFNHVGMYTGGGALFNTTSDAPNLNFPKIIGEVYCSTPDGSGGFYIYGNYRRETESTGSMRIEHVRSDNTFEPSFSLAVDALWKLNKILYYSGILYIGGNQVYHIGGHTAGDLSAIDVSTQTIVTWIPSIDSGGNVRNLNINGNTLYVLGDFHKIGGQYREGIVAINRGTGNIKSWHPTPNYGGYNDFKLYKNKVIVGGGFGESLFDNRACATIDTVTGDTIHYFFNSSNLYHAASVSQLALKGDTLYAFTGGTYDTRITAINLTADTFLWVKRFSMNSFPVEMQVWNNNLFLSGDGFNIAYRTNMTDDDTTHIERRVSNAICIDAGNGNLNNWFPNPVGWANEVRTSSISNANIFLGGTFTHMNGFERPGIVIIKASTETVLPFYTNIDKPFPDVKSMKLIDSTLYLAGQFYNINGSSFTSSVVSFNLNTGQLLPWHPANMGESWTIEADAANVYLGGGLTEPSGGSGRTNLFAISRATGTLMSWAPNPNNNPNCLHIANGNLYVGGKFTNISGQARNRLAAYDLSSLSLTTWNPNADWDVNAVVSTDSTLWVGGSFSKIGSINVGLLAGINLATGIVTDTLVKYASSGHHVNSITVKGKWVIAGGGFKINSSNPCNNVAMYDAVGKAVFPSSSFCEVFSNSGDVNTLSVIGTDLYVGGNFTNLNNKVNATNIERIRYPSGFFGGGTTDTVIGYYPQSGGNGGDVTINFWGVPITRGMHLKLVMTGAPDIIVPDLNISYPKTNEMKAVVDLRGKIIGNYDVIITDSAGKEHKYIDGFKVELFKEPQITAKIVGPSLIRTGRTTTFMLQLTNTGNCNAYGVPVFIYVSGDNTVKIPLKIYSMKDGSVLTELFKTDVGTEEGYAKPTKAYLPLIPNVPTESSVYIPIEITPHQDGGVNDINVVPNKPLFPSPSDLDNDGNIKIPEISDIVLPGIPEPNYGCAEALGTFIYDEITDIAGRNNPLYKGYKCMKGFYKIYNANKDFTNNSTPDNAYDLGDNILETAFDCTAAVLPIANIGKITYDILKHATHAGNDVRKYGNLAVKCSGVLDADNFGDSKSATSRNSIDPNDKFGIGINSEHYIAEKEQIQYGIHFENIDTATLPAQVVRVLDTLDLSKLDAATLQLGLALIGNHTTNFTPGKFASNNYAHTEYIDLRPGINLMLKADIKLNMINGVFEADFTSLDPATMLPTTNPLLGFLPPNIHSPEGEGCIYFSVNPKSGLPNKTEIQNRASIYFDANAPITTSTWVNTLDIISPLSNMKSLPETVNDTAVTISWQGKDGESGIEKYDIYYSVNKGSYQPYATNVRSANIQFVGKIDSIYSFYSIAIDSVGNREVKGDTAEATIKLVDNSDLTVFPNPSHGSFTVHVNSHTKTTAFSLFDLYGKNVELSITQLNGSNYTVNLPRNTPTGMYILKVKTESGTINKKVLVE
jgi:hypothetical protein